MAWGEPLSDQWDRRERQNASYAAIRQHRQHNASSGGSGSGGSGNIWDGILTLSFLAALSSPIGVAIAVDTGCIPYRTVHRVARAVGLEHKVETENGKSCPDASMMERTKRQIQENVQDTLSCIERKTVACVEESASDDARIDCLLGDIVKRRGLAEAFHPFTAIYAELPDSSRCYTDTFDSFHDCSYLNETFNPRGRYLSNQLPIQFVQEAETIWLAARECPADGYSDGIHERDWEAYTAGLAAECRAESVADWRRAARPLRQQYDTFKRQQEAMDQRPHTEQPATLRHRRGR